MKILGYSLLLADLPCRVVLRIMWTDKNYDVLSSLDDDVNG